MSEDTVLVNIDGLRLLADTAARNNTAHAFFNIALEWAEQASNAIDSLRAELAAERARAEAWEKHAAGLVADVKRFQAERDAQREQVRDTCTRAEKAEKDLAWYKSVLELAQGGTVVDVLADRDRLRAALTSLAQEFEALTTVIKPLANSEALASARAALEAST